MEFTHFRYPHGTRIPQTIDRPDHVELLARELREAGWSFEAECLPGTQVVHFDCCDDEGQLTNRVVENGPAVPDAVDDLVIEAHRIWVERGRPRAIGDRRARYEAEWSQDYYG